MAADTGWIEHKGIMIRTPQVAKGEPGIMFHSKVAAFSFNGTLVKTKSGSKTPGNRYDIDWWSQGVLIRLAELHSEDYSLVVIADETDVEKGNLTREDCKFRFDWLAGALFKKNIPIIGMFSLKSNSFRKPYTSMIAILKSLYNRRGEMWQIDMGKSFYVGSEGARLADKNKHLRADTGYKDRAFALNVGMSYYSPDEMFRKATAREWRFPDTVLSGDDKKIYLQVSGDMERAGPLAKYGGRFSRFVEQVVSEQKHDNALILIVGQRSSGKSTIAAEIVNENPDKFKMFTKGSQKIGKFLSLLGHVIEMGGCPVVEGPTFASQVSRAPFVAFAEDKHIPLIIVSVVTPYKLCLFYDRMRVARNMETEPIKLPQYKKFKADYQRPESDEEGRVIVIEWPLIINVEKEFWLTL